MGKYTEQQSAARQFYADAPRPRSAREVCEEGDDALGVLRDEAAEKLRRAGCGAAEAQVYVNAVLGVLRARDADVAQGAMAGQGGSVGGDAMGWMMAEDAADRMLRAISRAREARKSKLALGCWLFAMGRQPHGLSSERDLAREQDVSPEAVGMEREAFQRILKLERAPQQKSAAARAAYKGTNGAKAISR